MQGFVVKRVELKVRGRSFFTDISANVQSRRVVFSLRRDSARHGTITASASRDDNSGDSGSQGNKFLLSGATIATLLMLGGLHAKRLYDDQKSEQARQQGIELEFQPDLKAAFLQVLPLRLISRAFGMLTSVELPMWIRPYIFRSYCRAFHANLGEVAEKLENYGSLQKFFVRSLKAGCRPLDPNPSCLLSPVDGVMLRCGRIRRPGLAIEQVKGHSYSVSSLLGDDPWDFAASYADITTVDGAKHTKALQAKRQANDLFYCVLYLGPGDYHRVHSPTDWQVLCRRHFSGRLFPVNERAARTIRSLYVGNERVVLEGIWEKGFMALVAVGATNVGSIELKIEPDLKTNCRTSFHSNSSLSSFRNYGNKGSGYLLQKGDEVATFNLGSTVVLVFQAPSEVESSEKDATLHTNNRGFTFCVKQGERVLMGQAIGTW
eukprot:c14025_g1_i1 orf=227-1528(+)